MSAGACGAFVHGLEDEFLEVRSAAVTSICQLGTRSTSFAAQCVDFLVDMFNDEIQTVRFVQCRLTISVLKATWGGREGEREREREREGGRERGREGEREGGREGGRKGQRGSNELHNRIHSERM